MRRPSTTDKRVLDRQAAQRRRGGAAREVETCVPARLDRAGVVGGQALHRFGNGVDAALSSSSALMTVTGEGVSASVRRRIEPVTMTSSSASSCGSGAACAKTCEEGNAPAATAAANSARRTAALTVRLTCVT